MERFARSVALFVFPMGFAIAAFLFLWPLLLWGSNGTPEEAWPRLVALMLAVVVYFVVRGQIDTYLGPGFTHVVLLPIRLGVAYLVAVPMVFLFSEMVWRVLLLDAAPAWCFWAFLLVVVLVIGPWWVGQLVRLSFTVEVPPTFAARVLAWLERRTGEKARPKRGRAGRSRTQTSFGTRAWSWFKQRADERALRIDHVSGPLLLSSREVEEKLSSGARGGATYPWGEELPVTNSPLGSCAIGAPGSGKSLLIQKVMAAVLPRLGGEDRRALVFDYHGHALSLLDRFGVPSPKQVLIHPFAREGVVWDVARDLSTPTDVYEFAERVVVPPEEYRGEMFWPKAAQFGVQGIVDGLRATRGENWTLADFCAVTRSVERVRLVVAAAPGGKHKLAYMDDPENQRLFLSVLATLQAEVQELEPCARQWQHALRTQGARRYSIREWMAGSDVLVLGYEESHSRVFSTLNRIIFALAAKRLIDESRHSQDGAAERTWVFVDEAQNMAKAWDALPRVVNAARSKGACVVLGIQDLPGLEKLYPGLAKSMLNGLSNWACCRTSNPDTAKWLSEALGKRRVRELREAWDRDDKAKSTSENIKDAPLVRPEDLMAVNENGELRMFLRSDTIGTWRQDVRIAEEAPRFGSPSQGERAFSGPTRLPEVEEFVDWGEAELEEFGKKEAPSDKDHRTPDEDDREYRVHED